MRSQIFTIFARESTVETLRYFPTGPVGFREKFVGLRHVGDTHRCWVEFDLLPDAVGDVAEQYYFGERACVFKRTAGFATALRSFDPLAMMPWGFRQVR